MHYFFGEALTPVEEIAEIAAEKTVPGGTMLSQSGMITLWIGIVAYVGVLIGIGFWSSRKVKGMNDFLVAGRRLPLRRSPGDAVAGGTALALRAPGRAGGDQPFPWRARATG